MSAAAAGASRIRQRPPGMAPVVRGLILGTVTLDLAILIAGAMVGGDAFREAGWGLIPWILVVAAVGFASVPFESGQQLGLDLPVLLSVGYLFGPIVAGATAFVAYVDARELRGEIPWVRALFNRAQTSLSVMAATWIFGLVAGNQDQWLTTLVAALSLSVRIASSIMALLLLCSASMIASVPWMVLGGCISAHSLSLESPMRALDS